MSYFEVKKNIRYFQNMFDPTENKTKITFFIVRNAMQTYPSTSSQAT